MKVAVLGCGPAGLMAAHGVVMASEGADFDLGIFSHKRKSDLFGAQYLHEPIPGVTEGDPVVIDYRVSGSAYEYKRKVYGDRWDGRVSPEDFTEAHRAWDIRGTYDNLWATYEDAIMDTDVNPTWMHSEFLGVDWDIIINTIPMESLCYQGHSFGFTEVWAAGDAPRLGVHVNRMFQCPPNTVQCNGNDNPSWYRISNIFDHTTVEWPAALGMVPVPTAARVRKPTSTDCDCWPTIVRAGRYGSWTKGVLSHEAYNTGYDTMWRKLNAAAEAGA